MTRPSLSPTTRCCCCRRRRRRPRPRPAQVVERVVKPATATTRARYSELPALAPCVGVAAVFVSHVWNAPFADTVAAIAHILEDDACAPVARRAFVVSMPLAPPQLGKRRLLEF